MLKEPCQGDVTGSRAVLKTQCSSERAGSSPAPGIPNGKKKCPACGETKPFTEYQNRRKPAERALGLFTPQAYCTPCKAKKTREWQKANRDKVNATARRGYHRRMTDDEYRAAQQEYWRETKRLDARTIPDYHARKAEASRRYRERLKADPKRYAEFLESRRLSEKIRREREGKAIRGGKRDPDNSGRELPVEPLRGWLASRSETNAQIAAASGLDERTIYRIRKESKVVRVPAADAILTAFGYHLMDLWPSLYE